MQCLSIKPIHLSQSLWIRHHSVPLVICMHGESESIPKWSKQPQMILLQKSMSTIPPSGTHAPAPLDPHPLIHPAIVSWLQEKTGIMISPMRTSWLKWSRICLWRFGASPMVRTHHSARNSSSHPCMSQHGMSSQFPWCRFLVSHLFPWSGPTNQIQYPGLWKSSTRLYFHVESRTVQKRHAAPFFKWQACPHSQPQTACTLWPLAASSQYDCAFPGIPWHAIECLQCPPLWHCTSLCQLYHWLDLFCTDGHWSTANLDLDSHQLT